MTVFTSGKKNFSRPDAGYFHKYFGILGIVFVIAGNSDFVFFDCRDKDIPEVVGKYTIQFCLLVDKTNKLFSNQVGSSEIRNLASGDKLLTFPFS